MRWPEDFLNQIICGDCIEVMEEMPDDVIDLVVTSPPYNIGIDYGKYYNDKKSWSKYFEWCRSWLELLYKKLKSTGRLCINHYLSCGKADNRHAPLMEINHIALDVGFKHHAVAIWMDRTLSKLTAWGSYCSPVAPYINSPFEGVLILYKEKWKREDKKASKIDKRLFEKACSGIWEIPTDRLRLTSATFPIELPKYCISLLSFEGDIVLDPFCGSGTTALAAKELGRNYIGIEINPHYCEIAKKRVAQEFLFGMR